MKENKRNRKNIIRQFFLHQMIDIYHIYIHLCYFLWKKHFCKKKGAGVDIIHDNQHCFLTFEGKPQVPVSQILAVKFDLRNGHIKHSVANRPSLLQYLFTKRSVIRSQELTSL